MTFTVDDAIAIATTAHEGQTDKGGHPYIQYPLRVMHRVQGEYERMAAVLHDVLEDTSVTADDLRAAGCPASVIAAVEALTKQRGEGIAESMARAASDPIAAVVKRADIADNSNPSRLAMLDSGTANRLRQKYAESIRLLDEASSLHTHS